MLLFTSYTSEFPNSKNLNRIKDSFDDNYEDHLGTVCDLYEINKDDLIPVIDDIHDDILNRLAKDDMGDDEFFDYFPDKIHVILQLYWLFINETWPDGKCNRSLYQSTVESYRSAIFNYDADARHNPNDELYLGNHCSFPDYSEMESYIKGLTK